MNVIFTTQLGAEAHQKITLKLLYFRKLNILFEDVDWKEPF